MHLFASCAACSRLKLALHCAPLVAVGATSRWKGLCPCISKQCGVEHRRLQAQLGGMIADPRLLLGPTARRMPWVFTYNDWSAGTEYDYMVRGAMCSLEAFVVKQGVC